MSVRGLQVAGPLAVLVATFNLAVSGADSRTGQRPAFVDVTEASGVDLLTVSGTPAKEYIVESTTGGTAVFDYDNDGDVDIYIVNGSRLGGFEEEEEPRATLFRNEGSWRFTDVGADAGVDHAGWGMGCTPADYNADGWLDLFLANYGPNALYRNSEGVFTDIAAQAGVAHPGWGSAAAFADFDGDGDLDFYLSNYIDFDPEYRPPDPNLCRWRGLDVFCGPTGLAGAGDLFYRNNGPGGDWFFSAANEEFGLAANRFYGLGAVAGDFDNDGDPDLYIANDSTPNLLYRNDGGRFEETALLSGAALSENGLEQAGMGIAAGDYDNDGDFDLFVTNFANDYNTLYRNMGDGIFFDASSAAGLGAASFTELGWGAAFFDADNDGDEDLFVANGHVYPAVDGHGVGSSYAQRNQLFDNDGGGFRDVSDSSGSGFAVAASSRGSAFADFDDDGDLDLVVVNQDSRPTLLRNDGGNRGNWLQVKLAQEGHNTQAVGARVAAVAGGISQIREVRAGTGYLSQDDTRLHFGLGTERRVEALEIRWPDGKVELMKDLEVNRLIEVTRGGLLER